MHSIILKKTEVYNIFQNKPITITIVVSKPSIWDNVPYNVIIVVITYNQVPKQHVFKARELMKTKTTTNWQIKKHMCDSFVEESQKNNLTLKTHVDMNGPFHSNWVGLP